MTSVQDDLHYDSQRIARPQSEISLRLPAAVLDDLRSHGEQIYPHECCGILLGKADDAAITVHDAVRAGNTRVDSAHNRYNIEPADLLRAQREGRARGLDIVGFYHSHPDHPAMWSSTDLAEAHWFGCSYVITSVDGRNGKPTAHVTNSFLLTGSDEHDKAFADQHIIVEQI